MIIIYKIKIKLKTYIIIFCNYLNKLHLLILNYFIYIFYNETIKLNIFIFNFLIY